mgnify:CR=1 FL=1
MPQLTNLNVSPYFDDFNADNDYYRILFKPGYPVQARELTGLQSMLQNQIEKFGQHFFKEGTKVIPGNTSYTSQYKGIQLNNNFQGVPVSAYADQLVGATITGQTSGVTATVSKVLLPDDSENGNLTLYVSYLGSNTANNSTEVFSDAEPLTSSVTITSGLLGNTSISIGSPFAATISQNAAIIGSAFHVENGVYFIRGNFVAVEEETLILDQYSNTSSYRVGFNILEEIITPDLDETLNDNSQGFNNYAAPGADRLKITLNLFKKELDDTNDESFVELATVNEGTLRTKKNTTEYNRLADELARRTYEESGDYYVNPFDVRLVNSLNNNVGNQGIFQEGQFTYAGSTPSNDLGLYQISPGKAFVRGYEIETIAPTYLDTDKPRTTKTSNDQAIQYNTGPTLRLNNVYGSPTIGIGNTYVLSLRDTRLGFTTTSLPGKEIGEARVYDTSLESGTYNNTLANSKLNQWDISLYDVQTITELTVNEAPTENLARGTQIKGKNSGATGFVKYSVGAPGAASAGTALTITDVSGNFIKNESLIFNGIQNGRIAIAVTEYGISDVKSVYATNNTPRLGINTFCADTIQSTSFNIGIATISPGKGANYISTVRSPNTLFPGTGDILRINDLVEYGDMNVSTTGDPVMARVVSVGTSEITITGVTTISGIVNGKLPTTPFEANDFRVVRTNLSDSQDNTLYTQLPKENVSDVNLTDASLSIRKVYSEETIAANRVANQLASGENQTFLPFDPERYAVIASNGQIEELTADKMVFGNGMTTLDIINLETETDSGDVQIVTTLKKLKPTSKTKIKKRVNSIIVDKSNIVGSGIGTTTAQNGLEYGDYPFGTRVEDETISLRTPDVIRIHGIFETPDVEGTPSAPTMDLNSINSASTTTSEYIVGEQIVGQTSNAIAIVAERNDTDTLSFIFKNENTFVEGETIISQESNIQAVITTLNNNSFDISTNYTFDSGQESTFYNYGSITRKNEFDPPAKKIKVYFESAFYESTDTGDITTVDSYNTFNYKDDIQSVNGVRNTDMIDIRPRVSDYTVSAGGVSPLMFDGRTFDGSGNSAANMLASDESIVIDFSYYLGRVDRIFLTKDGRFQVQYGDPAEQPERPLPVDEAIEIAHINLPPYLYDVNDAVINFFDYKRYQMRDIQRLETRIQNLEYYTSLSLLELNTSSFFVPDSDGLNRFKSGFFVDNFEQFQSQDSSLPIKNSIDRQNKELRPSHYTNSIDLQFGPVVNVDGTEDLKFNTIEGINVRRNNDIITLDYSDQEWLKQEFGTRTESVTPFIVAYWNGVIELNPESDTWVNTRRLEARIVVQEGNFAETLANLQATQGFDQDGFGPAVWGSWNEWWSGQTNTRWDNQRRTIRQTGQDGDFDWSRDVTQRRRLIEEGVRRRREGVRDIVVEDLSQRESQGDRLISREVIPFMRSRNVEFLAKQNKPNTRVYPYFDGVDVAPYCIPKLIEIEMIAGSFRTGETVNGTTITQWSGAPGPTKSITFRVAQSNHKEGPYNIPTKTYGASPYNLNTTVQSDYSSTSTTLNVDTFSLAAQAQGEFNGWLEVGTILKGQYGAEAKVTNLRLVTDITGFLGGSFWVPDPDNPNFPAFTSGKKILKFTSDPQNNLNATSIAEDDYSSVGFLDTVQETIIATRNARVIEQNIMEEDWSWRVVGSEWINGATRNERRWRARGGGDPLAQSFTVDDTTGVFVTKVDIFFSTKDPDNIPCIFSLRTMQNGIPTQNIVPLSEVVLDPSDVEVSNDGTVATTVEFKAPVYLEGGMEYAMVLLSNSAKYAVYISRVGEDDLATGNYVANQPTLGSLFKSQNASTWEPSQWEDLKYTLYRADFVEEGNLEIYNPELEIGNGQIPLLVPNPLDISSKQVRVGLGTTLSDNGYVMGNTFYQEGTNATGDLAGVAGAAYTSLNIVNAGIGYTPLDGQFQFNGVVMDTITGNGRGATADVYISNGVAIAATVSIGGTGYKVGDVLGITTIGLNSTGRNSRFSITSIGSTNELLLENVQGNFVVGTANTLFYYKNTGTTGVSTELNYSVGGDVQIAQVNNVSDGLHIKVNHKNHGMYFTKNNVKITDVGSDINPTKLSTAYNSEDSGNISVADASKFSTFENVSVGTTNYGYLKIGEEIISYSSVSGNTIGITTRALQNTLKRNYPVGTPVYKYELGGVNLMRINATHGLSTTTAAYPNATTLDTSGAITFDSYNIKVDMSKNGTARNTDVGWPALYFNKTKSTGGTKIRATQNMPYEVITPLIQNTSVPTTTLGATVRTITGKSISGDETPYLLTDSEPISLNKTNFLDSPRIITSGLNASTFLSEVKGNKSLQMTVNLTTTDTRVSPVVDGERMSVILTSNRVNDIIKNYATDDRVSKVETDPTSCQYISKEMLLENHATSLKVLLAAHLHLDADIRVFYSVNNKEGVDPIFVPFPGYKNLNNKGEVIAAQDSDGLPDKFVSKSNSSGFDGSGLEFRDYTFSVDQLPSFRSYRIKILMTSESQVYVPRVKDLRVMALA